MEPTKVSKLFIITGASGIGKSSACEVLFRNERDYIVMESDILWSEIYNTPQDNYRAYRELWLNLCANISQIGLPVVLCGCVTPDQLEICEARKYFSHIVYIAVVADEKELTHRMKSGRNITDENWIKSSTQFNKWLIENAANTEPPIRLIDATCLDINETAIKIDSLIRSKMD